jgi:hypothetical protein
LKFVQTWYVLSKEHAGRPESKCYYCGCGNWIHTLTNATMYLKPSYIKTALNKYPTFGVVKILVLQVEETETLELQDFEKMEKKK